MKEILVSQPTYVGHFSCTGAACRDHCCKRWEITLDKSTYRKYLKSEIPDIRKIAAEHIQVRKTSIENWARINFNDAGNCFYLDEANLCQIHKQLGHQALSNTCASYPRTTTAYKNEEIKSLNMSCPEAVRHILFNDEAMLISNAHTIKHHYNQAPSVNTERKLLHLFIANLMMQSQPKVEENLYAVVYFILLYQKLTGSMDEKLPLMEKGFTNIVTYLNSGELATSMLQIREMQTLELQLLLGLQEHMVSIRGLRGQAKLITYIDRLNKHLQGELTEEQLSQNLTLLKKAWNDIALPWLNERPHILRNFLQYRFYHGQFGMTEKTDLLKELYLIVVDYFLIKSLLSVVVLNNGHLTDDDLIDVVYSFSTFRQHDPSVNNKFAKYIDMCKRNDDLSVLNLLV